MTGQFQSWKSIIQKHNNKQKGLTKMSRPIDADALISKLIDKKYNTLDSKIEFGDIIYMIQTEPTLNV